jgi:hypothetical protein
MVTATYPFERTREAVQAVADRTVVGAVITFSQRPGSMTSGSLIGHTGEHDLHSEQIQQEPASLFKLGLDREFLIFGNELLSQ